MERIAVKRSLDARSIAYGSGSGEIVISRASSTESVKATFTLGLLVTAPRTIRGATDLIPGALRRSPRAAARFRAGAKAKPTATDKPTGAISITDGSGRIHHLPSNKVTKLGVEIADQCRREFLRAPDLELEPAEHPARCRFGNFGTLIIERLRHEHGLRFHDRIEMGPQQVMQVIDLVGNQPAGCRPSAPWGS